MAVAVAMAGLQGGAVLRGCTPGFLSESVSEEKPWMDSFVAQILSSLESKAAAVEGASHDLVGYLSWPELHSYGSSQNCPCRVPGRQPVPGPEKMQNTSAWQRALKLAKPSPTHLENLKNKY